jgi:hypothetical protein
VVWTSALGGRAHRERVEVVGAIALQCPSCVIGDRSLLPETVGADEDMHDAAVGERIPFPHDSDRGHHRRVAEVLDLERDLEFVVEARRCVETRPGLGNQVEAVRCERCV